MTDQKPSEKTMTFDELMAEHDPDYIKKLEILYDSHQRYSKDFGDSARPFIDALSGDKPNAGPTTNQPEFPA